MKTSTLVLIASLFLTTVRVFAQTNATNSAPSSATNNPVPPLVMEAITGAETNWSIIGGYGHSTTGRNNLAFGDIAFNFRSSIAGAIVGYDYLWSAHQSAWNTIKGGVSLQTRIQPFAFIGLTNVYGEPFVADLLATPRNGNAIGNIVTTGLNIDCFEFHLWPTSPTFIFDAGVQYENRTGQAAWDGNYILVHLGFSRHF